jgi:CubicO group peptidase (beta-lactamase class C family)
MGPPTEIEVQGTVAAGFEEVRDAFAAFLADEPADPGAQLSAYVNGLQVVDLWAGDGMGDDSLIPTFSAIKGATHLVVALLVQDGVLDLDRRVAEYWPEFAAEGKGELTLRELLAHRSGAIGVAGGFTFDELADDRAIAARLAPHRPYWTPGKAYGYHGFVIGALAGEVVRRVTGRSIQEHFEERVRAPYGLDLYMGFPEALEDRWVPALPMAITPEQQAEMEALFPGPDSLLAVAFNLNANPPTDLVEFINTRKARALGQASAAGVGNARSLAKMYAAIIGEFDDRPPLLERETIAEFAKVHSSGIDMVTGTDVHTFGLGFEVQGIRYPFLGPDAFGHSGASGAQTFADPRSGVTYGYVRRRFQYPPEGGAVENHRLAAAVIHAATAP